MNFENVECYESNTCGSFSELGKKRHSSRKNLSSLEMILKKNYYKNSIKLVLIRLQIFVEC